MKVRHVALKTNLRRAAKRARARSEHRVGAAQLLPARRRAAERRALRQAVVAARDRRARRRGTTRRARTSVRVAIVDSGINAAEPDLAPNVRMDLGWDFVSNDADASDNVGHGTHVAGIVAARGNNGIGISGVAWRASLIPVRVLGQHEHRHVLRRSRDGMAYAVQQGARVVNLSLGSPTPCQPERDVIDAAPDVLFVIAAMNDSQDVDAGRQLPVQLPVAEHHLRRRDRRARPARGLLELRRAGRRPRRARRQHPQHVRASGARRTSSPTRASRALLGGDWVTGGTPNTWGRSFTYWHSGSWSLSDSPSGQYANNTDNYAALIDGIDLTGRRDCAASVYARTALADDDVLLAETSPDLQTLGQADHARSAARRTASSAGSSTCPSSRATPAAGWRSGCVTERERDGRGRRARRPRGVLRPAGHGPHGRAGRVRDRLGHVDGHARTSPASRRCCSRWRRS